MERKKDFSDETKLKALLCCDRHCCLCGKQCSTDIEIHHIERDDNNFPENAIPLCFDCHAKVHMYNDRQPIGLKYRKRELIERRKQIYDRYTAPYTPNIFFNIEGGSDKSDFKDSKFLIQNKHQYLYCKVRTLFKVYHKGKLIHKGSGIFGGETPWHMNPDSIATVRSNFIPSNLPKTITDLKVQIGVIIIDKFGWEHELLPVCWIYTPSSGWYYSPHTVKIK